MAQWAGQFSGRTHATRAAGMEGTLRLAVAAYRAADTEDARHRKAKAVRNLAAKLLTARLKLLKARIADLRPVAAGKGAGNEFEALQQREATTRAEGVNGILAEFGAPDAGE